QVVVYRLRYVYRLDGITHLLCKHRDLQAGVGGIAAAVVEEIADIVRLEDLDQPLVFPRIVFKLLQFVPSRAEGTRRRISQCADGSRRFFVRVDEVLLQRADDTIAPGVDFPDLALVLAARLDHTAR